MTACLALNLSAIGANYLATTDAPMNAYYNSGISWDYGPWLLPQNLSGLLILPGLLLWLPICWCRRCGPRHVVPLLLASHVVTLLILPVTVYEGWRMWRWINAPE
ncbi:MAG TPA: hypothetical protein VK196_10850 [Magnetospirillum sp.]|nr:hypothetical protein [Magnetospirillum sp.]